MGRVLSNMPSACFVVSRFSARVGLRCEVLRRRLRTPTPRAMPKLTRLAVVFLELFSQCRSRWIRWGVCWYLALVHQFGANPNIGKGAEKWNEISVQPRAMSSSSFASRRNCDRHFFHEQDYQMEGKCE